MRLEYFQMVDRISALDPQAGAIRTACDGPPQSPVFEGHFPGYPLLPGVLMIETMAQTGGWLVLARLRFARMPFLVRVKGQIAQLRRARETLAGWQPSLHDGSGFAVIEAVHRSRRPEGGVSRNPLRAGEFPIPQCATHARKAREMRLTARRAACRRSCLQGSQ